MNANLLPEVFISDANISYKITRLVQQGKVRNITGKLYTSNMTDEINIIINRRLWEIVGLLFPNSIIADRTAFELKPNKHKEIFIISDKSRAIALGS